MLSEKKRIKAKLGGGGAGVGGSGIVNAPMTKTRSFNLRAPGIVRATTSRGGWREAEDTAMRTL